MVVPYNAKAIQVRNHHGQTGWAAVVECPGGFWVWKTLTGEHGKTSFVERAYHERPEDSDLMPVLDVYVQKSGALLAALDEIERRLKDRWWSCA